MLPIVLQMFGGACLGLLGAELGRIAFNGATKTLARPELTTALRYRSLIFGGLVGGGPLMMFAIHDPEPFSRAFGVGCLVSSSVLSLSLAVAWLHLVTTHGQKNVEAGELILILAILPFAFLYVCGILWITLGTVLVLGVLGYGGLHFYRSRVRARPR